METFPFESLAAAGLLAGIDLHFARLVCRRAGCEEDYALFLAAVLASHAVNRRRQICLSLRDLPEQPGVWLAGADGDEPEEDLAKLLAGLSWPTDWEEHLAAHPAVAGPGEADAGRHFLVLDEGRLYLQRYWKYERDLARMIARRLDDRGQDLPDNLPSLARLAPRFAGSADGEMNYQSAAVLAGLRHRFAIISGGPGCGKTSVAAAIAAVWLELEPDLRIVLCAPTGLAQARLRQALREEIRWLDCSDTVRRRLEALPAATIHRLLGFYPGLGFRYHGGRRLECDLLIVDESSMVPLWVMSSLFAALPDECRVVLLGDRYQLASVEAGAVLAELCDSGAANRFSPDFHKDLARLVGQSAKISPAEFCESGFSPLRDRVVELVRSHRFSATGGIARLQKAILSTAKDEGAALRRVLEDDESAEVKLRRLPGSGPARQRFLLEELAQMRVEYEGKMVLLRDFASCGDVRRSFAIFKAFRLLTPLRRGTFGVERLNRLVPRALGLATEREFYHGRAVMIRENAPRLELYNGDVGLILEDERGELKAWFEPVGDDFRAFSPARLPAHETAFAMTVHKAQGSGFQRVVLLWPERDSPLLTREMLYTAVTRTISRLEIWLPENVGIEDLTRAARRRVQREGGLYSGLCRVCEAEGRLENGA
ncbi:MAG: exodeoxyribonuclease V subunit alpha [Deltaproteobacteria bacterium]|nr:exodeoxyribonuclease V subunit alpha [Deltaproteobacteria bacterium]